MTRSQKQLAVVFIIAWLALMALAVWRAPVALLAPGSQSYSANAEMLGHVTAYFTIPFLLVLLPAFAVSLWNRKTTAGQWRHRVFALALALLWFLLVRGFIAQLFTG